MNSNPILRPLETGMRASHGNSNSRTLDSIDKPVPRLPPSCPLRLATSSPRLVYCIRRFRAPEREMPVLFLPCFPLVSPPRCTSCESTGTRHITCADNPNGNAGRPYWLCPNEECPRTLWKRKDWICWDDSWGISRSNLRCECQAPSRLGVMGRDIGRQGFCFWSCPLGWCSYYSEDCSGATWKQLEKIGRPCELFYDRRFEDAIFQRLNL